MGNHVVSWLLWKLGDGFTEWIEVALWWCNRGELPRLGSPGSTEEGEWRGKQNNVDKAQKSSIQDLEGKLCPVPITLLSSFDVVLPQTP